VNHSDFIAVLICGSFRQLSEDFKAIMEDMKRESERLGIKSYRSDEKK